MAFELVIVESPAKARTVSSLLGGKYRVKATIGHVRDLPKSRMGVDVEHNFTPKYLIPQDKKSVVKEIKDAAKDASVIYLATDPDREGEAISWHLVEAADLKVDQIRRVAFHEITKEGVEEAMSKPRAIDMHMVNAQQARRILDRLVGYSISPLLWRKVKSRLSAGRVQSVALRMVVEREREIENFVKQEYWSIDALLSKIANNGRKPTKAMSFTATLLGLKGDSKEELELHSETETEAIVAELRNASYSVADVRKGKNTRRAQPPFITSTLQQEAYRKLGFGARQTMSIAQQLYEGLDVGSEGQVGLITYMRTDSTRVSENAINEAREYLQGKYGGEYVPKRPNVYTKKSKGAQEAHEAIRPTSILREPDRIKQYLTSAQFRLYDLIWKRMVASQTTPARYETTAVDIDGATQDKTYLLRANDSVMVFPGFTAIYSEGQDEDEKDKPDNNKKLPELSAGEALNLLELDPKQHFTQPPPRYTDASLVKALEANGIGRPSTYASIMSTIQDRGYVERVERQLRPMEMGVVVNDILTEHFQEVVDIGFTAGMEAELDQIASGSEDWVGVVRDFYKPFAISLKKADENIEKVEIVPEWTGEDCELCGKPLLVRQSKYGRFIACSGFPGCRYTRPILNTIGVTCPQCGGDLVGKRTKRGRTFYGCSNYPSCGFASWDRPLPEKCPECGGLMVQSGSSNARCTQCSQTFSMDAIQKVPVATP